MVGLRLLEGGLAVLADHHERRQEDGLERHDEGQLRPWVRLDEEHPQHEHHGVDVDEPHRTGEGGDGIGDAQLRVGAAAVLVSDQRRMVLGVRVELGHGMSSLNQAAAAH